MFLKHTSQTKESLGLFVFSSTDRSSPSRGPNKEPASKSVIANTPRPAFGILLLCKFKEDGSESMDLVAFVNEFLNANDLIASLWVEHSPSDFLQITQSRIYDVICHN